MELKVSVDNSIRLICGLKTDTTVQEVIFALANSIQQTGRFYLIEKVTPPPPPPSSSSLFQNKTQLIIRYNRMPRILSPNEKLIDILNRVSNKNELIEFHLFKSKYINTDKNTEKLIEAELITKLRSLSNKNEFILPSTQNSFYLNNKPMSSSSINSSRSADSPPITDTTDSNTDCLFKNIHSQQMTLEEQSIKLDDLFKLIESYEIANLQLSQENESFKMKLMNLEAINLMNASKLDELEQDTNEETLLKETELNDYLKAQRDYYERKLNDLQASIETKKQEASNLNNQLIEMNKEFENEKRATETECIRSELNESNKQFELNAIRLDYLERSAQNIENCLNEKYKLIDLLESELDNNNNNNNNNNNKLEEETSSINSIDSSSSSMSSCSSCSSTGGGDLNVKRIEIINKTSSSSSNSSSNNVQHIRPNRCLVDSTHKKIRSIKSFKLNKFDSIHYF
jgi:hypothetical protein